MNNIENQFFTTRVETKNWLNDMKIKNYTINDDLTVDVKGHVDISNKKLTYLPVQLGIVFGNFNCNYNQLESLKGCPKNVSGDFYCYHNKITSLENGPEKIGYEFDFHDNPIKQLNTDNLHVRGKLTFTAPEDMNFLDYYKDSKGSIEIYLYDLKKFQALQKLNEKLSDDLSVKSVKIKHKI